MRTSWQRSRLGTHASLSRDEYASVVEDMLAALAAEARGAHSDARCV